MDSGVEKDLKGEPVDKITVGSVTIPIYFAPVTIKSLRPAVDGNGPPQETTKTYDSYILSYYEGSRRAQPRRSTLDEAKKHAKEIATRLNKDGARAECRACILDHAICQIGATF